MSHRSLLLGAGNSRVKKLHMAGEEKWGGDLVTLDINPNCGADIVWDVSDRPLPFPDETFDEIHAYDCLEHWGAQGDWRAWFDEMGEYHRILKPGGAFYAIVPVGNESFADPGHTRFLRENHFCFLSQAWYEAQLSRGLPVTDYRWYWAKDFVMENISKVGHPEVHHIGVVLRKPAAQPA